MSPARARPESPVAVDPAAVDAAAVDAAAVDAAAVDAAVADAAVIDAAVADPAAGRRLVTANRWFTWGFVVWSVLAVLVRPLRVPLAALDLVAFGAGCVAYLLAYATAVARSRTDAIGLGALFFLAEGAAPPAVRRSFWLWTSVQVVVGVAAAAVRPFTAVAFGVLVPIVGLSLMGLWSARHGRFPGRSTAAARRVGARAASTDQQSSTHEGAAIEQNGAHG